MTALRETAARLGIGHEESDGQGMFSAERIECQAACTHGPILRHSV